MSETDDLELRLREFTAVQNDADWDDVRRRAGEWRLDRGLSRRRVALAVAFIVCASLSAVFIADGTRPTSSTPVGPPGVAGPGPLPTLAQPLPRAAEVSLSDAQSAFGGRIVLPDIPQASSSDVGTVWLNQPNLGPTMGSTSATAAVTFPAAGVWVEYERGVNTYTDDVLLQYQAFAHQDGGSQVIDLSGVPALTEDSGGTSNRAIRFSVGGVTVVIIGRADLSTMRSMAQSIVDRSEAPPDGQLGRVNGIQLFPYFPPARPVDLADASATLGSPVVLPDTPLASASSAGPVWAERSCPAPEGVVTDASIVHACWIWISFPSTGLSVGYLRPPMYRGTRSEWKLQARTYGDNAHEVELGNVPALAIEPRDPYPGSVEFDLNGTRVVVAGNYDTATLRTVAQSIVDRASG